MGMNESYETRQFQKLDTLLESCFDRKKVKEMLQSFVSSSARDDQVQTELEQFQEQAAEIPVENRILIIQYYRFKAINDIYKQIRQFKSKVESIRGSSQQIRIEEAEVVEEQPYVFKKGQQYKLRELEIQAQAHLSPRVRTTEEPPVVSHTELNSPQTRNIKTLPQHDSEVSRQKTRQIAHLQ
jgi:TolA-binding protein